MRKYIEQKLSQGLCINCGKKSAAENSQQCPECKELGRLRCEKSRKKAKQYRLSHGLCIDCGKHPILPGITSCQSCKDRKGRQNKTQRAASLSQGICTVQGCNNPLFTKALCQPCLDRIGEQRRQRSLLLKEQGLCSVCAKAPSTACSLCETCQLKHLAGRYLDCRDDWQLLKQKFVEQNGKCAYTGVPLEIGATASVDHIVPRANGGKNQIDNYQWVHYWVNLMKRATSHDEFVIRLDKFINDIMLAYRSSSAGV